MKKYFLLLITAFLLVNFTAHKAHAQATEGDDSFDPFSDYNEFEQESDEEADINFLRNGRYLSLALVTGYRGFTGGFAQAYTGAFSYGAQFSYFFDLNIAAAFSYTTGDHGVAFNSFNSGGSVKTNYSGNVNIQAFDLQVKYYFNTDNVTKGLADLNPYVLAGTGFFTRTYNLNQQFATDPDRVIGFRAGGGLEIPLLRRRFYLGLQAMYTYVQFPDENNGFIDESGGTDSANFPISPRLNGDIYEFNILLGTSF